LLVPQELLYLEPESADRLRNSSLTPWADVDEAIKVEKAFRSN
jgi:hypothetical protein